MESFEIKHFNEIASNFGFLSELQQKLKEWKIDEVDLFSKRLINARKELLKYYYFVEYQKNGKLPNDTEVLFDRIKKNFECLSKNKQQQLLEIFYPLLTITFESERNRNPKVNEIFDRFKKNIHADIGEFIEQISNYLPKNLKKNDDIFREKYHDKFKHYGKDPTDDPNF